MKFVDYVYGNKKASEILKKIAIGFKLYYPYNIFYMNRIRNDKNNSLVSNAVDFFDSNATRINSVCTWLYDEKSVDVYRKCINLRKSYKREFIPPHCYKDQYFPNDIPEFSKNWGGNEIIVDCGAFSGDITMKFAQKVKNYAAIYAFEPDKANITELEKKKAIIHDLHIVQAACSDKDGFLHFIEQSNSGGSHVTQNDGFGVVEVPSRKIDSVIAGGRCDFIKMDIEGAEWDALHGAKETILKNKPKLAISIYHSNEDMIRLIEYIHNLVPEYRLYVRAHTMGIAETILYAII